MLSKTDGFEPDVDGFRTVYLVTLSDRTIAKAESHNARTRRHGSERTGSCEIRYPAGPCHIPGGNSIKLAPYPHPPVGGSKDARLRSNFPLIQQAKTIRKYNSRHTLQYDIRFYEIRVDNSIIIFSRVLFRAHTRARARE